jgi:hypothetical protein
MNPEIFSAIVGLYLIPMVISFLKNCSWSDTKKMALTFFVCIVVGAGTAYVGNQLVFTWAATLANILVVVTASQVAYNLYFKDSSTNKSLEAKVVLP